jgi:hypothetical protein
MITAREHLELRIINLPRAEYIESGSPPTALETERVRVYTITDVPPSPTQGA